MVHKLYQTIKLFALHTSVFVLQQLFGFSLFVVFGPLVYLERRARFRVLWVRARHRERAYGVPFEATWNDGTRGDPNKDFFSELRGMTVGLVPTFIECMRTEVAAIWQGGAKLE